MEGFIEIVEIEVGLELRCNSSLEDFRQVGEVGDGLVVVGDVGVKTRFFQYGGDSGKLEWGGGYKTRGQRGVDDVGDERGERGEAGLD